MTNTELQQAAESFRDFMNDDTPPPPAPTSGSDVVDLGATDDLWTWFGLSYASFLTLPRVLMHEMPDEWQRQMAKLLWEYQEAFPNQPDIETTVLARKDGRLIKMPEWLCNYRHPDVEQIALLRQNDNRNGYVLSKR